jgi:hypothetical protein
MALLEDFSFVIQKHIGALSQKANGWTTELNVVAWGKRPPKYDIRSWSTDHQKMGKGVTFTTDELIALKKILNNFEIPFSGDESDSTDD